MTFTSASFIIFCLLLFALYYIVPKKAQWMLLLAGSYAFYLSYDWRYLFFIILTTVSAYFASNGITKIRLTQKKYLAENKELDKEEKKLYKANMKKKMWKVLLLCLVLNFGVLFALKYINFAIGNVNSLLSVFTDSSIPTFEKLFLPLGISFYTFQTMGYMVDVYYGRYEAEKNIFRLALFTSFFPQLLQGPIGRYNLMAPTLFAEHKWDGRNITYGLERIIWGYFKKVLIADRMLIAVKSIIAEPDTYKGVMVIVGMLFYAAQLYADFTGGIDITIGIAQLFGVKLSENFERPFFSKNIAEYWRRWHITLGTWFKDYTFYPLSTTKGMLKLSKFCKEKFGVNASKKVPVYIASIVLWFVTGAWHGASWNFILWGLGNCFVILVSQELTPLYNKFYKKYPGIDKKYPFRAMQILRTNAIMCLLRTFDCYPTVGATFKAVGTIFTSFNISALWDGTLMNLGLSAEDYIIAGVGIITLFTVSMLGRGESVRDKIYRLPFAVKFGIFALLVLLIVIFGAYGIGFDSNQFIYSQF